MKTKNRDDATAGFEDGMAAYEREDYQTAIELLKPSAQNGNVIAAKALGYIFYNSDYLEDEEEAARWYLQAARQGDLDAQIEIASMYHNGLPYEFVEGSSSCDEEAFKWYLTAAKRGDVDSQRNVGDFYADGTGIKQDNKKAVFWYRLAAEQGDYISQNCLAYHYAQGLGVDQNLKESADLYRSSAMERSAIGSDSRYHLGLMYSKGEGVAKDLVQAYAYLTGAMEWEGHEGAAHLREILAKQMTAVQIEEAERLALE